MTRARPYDGVLGAIPPGLPDQFRQEVAATHHPWSTDFGSSRSQVLRCSVLPAEAQELAGFRMHVIVVCSETEIEIVAKEFECTRKGRSVEMKRLAPFR
jgi:hypothetical protein